MKSEILGLHVNTLTANSEGSCSNRENLQIPSQIKLSKNPEGFCSIVLKFLKST